MDNRVTQVIGPKTTHKNIGRYYMQVSQATIVIQQTNVKWADRSNQKVEEEKQSPRSCKVYPHSLFRYCAEISTRDSINISLPPWWHFVLHETLSIRSMSWFLYLPLFKRPRSSSQNCSSFWMISFTKWHHTDFYIQQQSTDPYVDIYWRHQFYHMILADTIWRKVLRKLFQWCL